MTAHLAEAGGVEKRVIQVQHQQQTPGGQHARQAVRAQPRRLAVADSQPLMDVPA